ncbi:MAG TPA: hypothetical protein VFX48_07220 [Saprospiraceae bacterium]|nr:hypothetical protein [Saprospiraceae bacterium]
MRRRIWICLLFLGLLNGLEARQWFVFVAKEGIFDGVLRKSFGHLYVVLVRENPQTGEKLVYGSWGFYPKGGIKANGFLGYMGGEIRNDWGNYMDHGFSVEVSEHQFLAGLELYNSWKTHPYSLLGAVNCQHFVQEFVLLVAHLRVPKGNFILPSQYLRALKECNPHIDYAQALKSVKPRPVLRPKHNIQILARLWRTNP